MEIIGEFPRNYVQPMSDSEGDGDLVIDEEATQFRNEVQQFIHGHGDLEGLGVFEFFQMDEAQVQPRPLRRYYYPQPPPIIFPGRPSPIVTPPPNADHDYVCAHEIQEAPSTPDLEGPFYGTPLTPLQVNGMASSPSPNPPDLEGPFFLTPPLTPSSPNLRPLSQVSCRQMIYN